MRKVKATLCLIFLSNWMFAQTVEVKYYENSWSAKSKKSEEILEADKQEVTPNLYSYTLTYRDGISTYRNDDFSEIQRKKSRPESALRQERNEVEASQLDKETVIKGNEVFYFKNIHSGAFLALLQSGDRSYSIKDRLFEFNWEITDEIKEIQGHRCRKAISNYLDNDYEVWFAEDIPVSAGPGIFGGLAGLILEAKTKELQIVGYAISFNAEFNDIEEPVLEGESLTFLEVDRIQKADNRDLRRTSERSSNERSVKDRLSKESKTLIKRVFDVGRL